MLGAVGEPSGEAASKPAADAGAGTGVGTGTDAPRDELGRLLSLLMFIAVVYRVAYHATYLGEVPFALGTFSDGAVYEQAALDILERPPLGTRPFYLQGAYAYLLTLGMAIRPWSSLGLIVQLLLSAGVLVLVHRRCKLLWGPRAATYGTLALLLHPGLSFYENKYLSAELGICANLLMFVAFTGVLIGLSREPERRLRRVLGASLALGAAAGLAVLARPNMILAVPFAVMAVVACLREEGTKARALGVGALLLGSILALAPMAARNYAVTGYPDIQPVHGGGTSFFIGNNPKSKGVWNDGGLLSARLGTESSELAEALGISTELDERAQARAIGDALYARAFAWIAENPGDFARLEVHKLWLSVGNDQLSQDYDWLGERELIPWAHRVGVPFALLVALGLIGAGVVFRPGEGPRWRPEDEAPLHEAFASVAGRRGLAWLLAGLLLAPLAANLLFFTSSQHRLPLIVPAALVAGPGVAAIVALLRRWRGGESEAGGSPRVWLLVVAVLVAAQGAWPRTHRSEPSPVHYYNLAMVQDEIGDPREALKSFDRAIELRPEQPLFHMRRAHMRMRLEDLEGAQEDLNFVFDAAAEAEAKGQPLPDWIVQQALLDQASVDFAREHPEARRRIER